DRTERGKRGEQREQRIEGDAGRDGHDPMLAVIVVNAEQDLFPPCGGFRCLRRCLLGAAHAARSAALALTQNGATSERFLTRWSRVQPLARAFPPISSVAASGRDTGRQWGAQSPERSLPCSCRSSVCSA